MSGQPLDMGKWFNFYSFDVMGDLGFGSPFGMLESGEQHWAIKLLNDGMEPHRWSLPIWMFRLLLAIPGLAAGYWRFVNFCTEQLDRRMKQQGEKENLDITHTLIEHYEKNDDETKKTQLHMLRGDSRLIIVAGSDTTAATLVHLFYHLATETGLVERLRAELDELLGKDGPVEHLKIQDAPLLNGAIDETLRLHPPVPSGVFRKTPKEGVTIGGTYIPGDTVVQMPQYAMSRGKSWLLSSPFFCPLTP